MKKKEAFPDIENPGSYLVYGCKSKAEALNFLQLPNQYPEAADEKFTEEDAKEAFSRKCLDCLSEWISDDTCGECGEPRLSKRMKPLYWISKDTL